MDTILGLHFQTTVEPTAIATLLLALATFILAILAWHALVASRDEVNVLRTQSELENRPVIIPVLDHRRMDLGPLGTTARMPKLTDAKTLVVPAENIGMGPAIHLRATVELLQPAGAPTSDAEGRGKPTELIGLARTSFTALEIEVHRWPAGAGFRLTLEYEGLVKERWQTKGDWNGESKRWTDVNVRRWDEQTGTWRDERSPDDEKFSLTWLDALRRGR